MSFGTGFASGLGNTMQSMMLKQMMMRGQPGQAQEPMNPYAGPQGGGAGYDPQAVEGAMDQALGKQPDAGGIQASPMNPQMQTPQQQMPPPNILAGLKALMMGQGGF